MCQESLSVLMVLLTPDLSQVDNASNKKKNSPPCCAALGIQRMKEEWGKGIFSVLMAVQRAFSPRWLKKDSWGTLIPECWSLTNKVYERRQGYDLSGKSFLDRWGTNIPLRTKLLGCAASFSRLICTMMVKAFYLFFDFFYFFLFHRRP